MDIRLLSEMLGKLLKSHQEVGLPGLGGFVSVLYGASFSDKGYTINPPYRSLEFRENVAENKLLASAYASSNGIPKQQASDLLQSFVAELKKELERNRGLEFPGLGKLKYTSRGGLFFIEEENLDIFPDCALLPPVSLKYHGDLSGALGNLDPIPEKKERIQEAAHVEKVKENRGKWWIAPVALASAAVVLLCVFLILCETAPAFIDNLLYTEEELAIINY